MRSDLPQARFFEQRSEFQAALLEAIEARAKQRKVKRLFVLTTRTAHWFIERGFDPAPVSELPKRKQDLYNFQRRSQVLIKHL